MAIISNYIHHPGATNMLVPFNSTSMILANRVYDVNFNMISDEIVDIPSYPNCGLRSSQSDTWVNKVKYYYPTVKSPFLVYQILNDVSTENPVYGYSSMVDPYDSEYSYTFAGWSSSDAGTLARLYKIDTKGNVIVSNPIRPYSSSYHFYDCAIIDINEKDILIRGTMYNTSSAAGSGSRSDPYIYPYTYVIVDKNTLEIKKVLGNTTGNSGSVPEAVEPYTPVLERTDSKLWIFSHVKNKPYFIDRGDYTLGIRETPVKDSSVVVRGRNESYSRYNKAYGDIPSINLTAEINGYHYYLNWKQTIDNNRLTFQAFKIDTINNTYETIDGDNMNIVVTDQCYNGGLPVLSVGKISVAKSGDHDFYLLKKVADRDFMVIHGMVVCDGNATHISRPTFKTRYIYVRVDHNDPSKLTLMNEKELEFNYEDAPLFMDNDKLGFVKHDIGIDVYRINTTNCTLDKFWEISTPDIGFATWFNGYLWWSNYVTNELHYETEDNIMTIHASLDKNIYQLEDVSDTQDAIYTIYITDNNNDRVSSRVELVLNGPITFTDGSTVKVITTSSTKETKEIIKVTGPGKPRVSAKILN